MATLHIQSLSKEGTRIQVEAGRHRFWIDEPPAFGGKDTAPSPVEMLLASLAGALNAIGYWTAAEQGITLRQLRISVDGDCDGACFFGTSFENRAGFQSIRVSMHVDTDASEEQLNCWREQVFRRCPVLDNLTAPVPVDIRVDAGL